MARACIHTLEPMEHGGVMAKVRVAAELLRRCGYSPRLLYTATDQVPTGGWGAKMRYFLQHPRPYQTEFEGYPGFAVPHWPLPIWATYALPWLFFRRAIANHHINIVISGANHCGLPCAIARKRYIVWIGTLYEDELTGKAVGGDHWAQQMLTGMQGGILDKVERFVFERAALILTNGSHTAHRVREAHPDVSEKVRTAMFAVDTNVFRPATPDDMQPDSAPYLLLTGRINDPRKNVGMLFRAFARVCERRPDFRLILTGDQPWETVRAMAREVGVAAQVEFVGRQTKSELVRLYQGAELFVLSSNQEGLGISVLEAMACGTPVVATRCGGPESVLVDGETGFMVPLNDDAAMAERLIQLLSDPPLMVKMRENCVRVARETFSRPIVEKILLQAFRDVYPEHFLS